MGRIRGLHYKASLPNFAVLESAFQFVYFFLQSVLLHKSILICLQPNSSFLILYGENVTAYIASDERLYIFLIYK